MSSQRKNIILEKTFKFSLDSIDLYMKIVKEKEFILSKQMLRSATSIGSNVEESIAAQSRKDFISKMTIAAKEARETKYWLRLLHHSQIIKFDYSYFINEADEIVKILTSIVKSTQEKNHKGT